MKSCVDCDGKPGNPCPGSGQKYCVPAKTQYPVPCYPERAGYEDEDQDEFALDD